MHELKRWKALAHPAMTTLTHCERSDGSRSSRPPKSCNRVTIASIVGCEASAWAVSEQSLNYRVGRCHLGYKEVVSSGVNLSISKITRIFPALTTVIFEIRDLLGLTILFRNTSLFAI